MLKSKPKVRKPKPKFSKGILVVYNEEGTFGDKNDELFYISSHRYGKCINIPEKQWWYSGLLLKIDSYESEGVPQAPAFKTTLTNASESNLKKLDNLSFS